MPGIVGIIGKGMREGKREGIKRMVGSMMHEPEYVSGRYVNEEIGIYAGWVCHKDSFSDCMPLISEDKSKILIFEGENFADLGTVQGLRGKGHEFQDLDGSYLIHQYEDEGEEFFRRLNGWFSGVLVDLVKGKVTIFNDRYGMGRLYYHENKDGFYFSSEAKAILKILPEVREISPLGLGEFFAYGCTLQNRTLFKHVFILPGGSVWVFEEGKIKRKENYFTPRKWESQETLNKEVFYEELKGTIRKVVPRYFHSKRKIGMSLTGGIDTRVIMGFLDGRNGVLPCYTFGGMYRDCYDVLVGRKVANACNQPHYVLRLGIDFLSAFPETAWRTTYLTDGCLDICGSHEVYLNILARTIAPVRMTGNYGSEILRKFSQFKQLSINEIFFDTQFMRYIQIGKETLKGILEGSKISFSVFKEIPWLLYGKLAAAQSQLTVRTPYMDNDLVCLMYQAPPEVFDNRDISVRLIRDGNPELSRIETDRGLRGTDSTLLVKLQELINLFMFKGEWYYNYGIGGWISRADYMFRSLHLERIILGRHKIEHYRIWFQKELSKYLWEILWDQRSKTRGHINAKFLERALMEHIKGKKNYTEEINRLISAELIYRTLIDG